MFCDKADMSVGESIGDSRGLLVWGLSMSA